MTSIRKNKLFMAVLYALVFFMLAEWLTPVIVLTATGHKALFLIFVAAGLLMAFLRVPWWFSGPLKTLYILWFIVYVYTGNVFFTSEAIAFLWTDFGLNFSALMSQNWAGTTDVFRTVLFFVLLWMAIYLIHYWVSFRLSIFLFYLLTVIFIAVLDTFSPYSGETAIIRIMVIGLLLAGLLHLARWMEGHRILERTDKLAMFAVPLVLLVAGSTALALYLPKAGPIWPDPVPFITSFSGQGGVGSGGNVGRIGYGVDDSRLGGSFIGDDTAVFQAEVSEGQYWKVESKDYYTTKGWELTENVGESFVYGNSETVETDFVLDEEEELESARLSMEQGFPFVLYPYGTESFTMEESLDYQYSTVDQRFETYQDGEEFEPEAYEISFTEPSYSLTALRDTSPEELAELPAEFDRFLQLPDGLPERVGDLAAEVTESSETVYDKTRAIERYFSTSGFEYSQSDIPVPEADEDYVDQFLFETQRGYCDNFSTSMVVMLRSLDIPARWVKGFNEGELVDSDGDTDVYQVTNNNAHSWVEAYMPGVGWMLFEPTIGFTGASAIDFDLELDADDPEQPEEQELPLAEDPETAEEEEAAIASGPSFWDRFTDSISANRWKILWTLAGLVLAAAILFKIRHKWMPKLLVSYYRRGSGGSARFEKAYLRLLKQLELYGINRRPGQTLKSYAAYIDSFFGTREMSKLTEAYERTVYGGDEESVDWPELRESWENLINRTSG
ncbi:transglutaminase-like putative cysteine protease [Planomicrobium stackebrandtii]|uniref:Transglutaminase-like putative cysteine protease n=1 Tax=Planomicrobium stackebrandtii TaxID=253160 RepID=A0ABU0GTV1_9BACL|nr:transglutaminase domain-containing protein [Planomicrobium stackebrandtii]MDQ0428791.1 transglutaminase-like putative cysteine protease [Planomicrobium stackebrandtii]